MNLIQELQWRGMVQDIMPGTEEKLLKEKTIGYIGFDPTADSLHIGSLVQIILLMHLQRAGHQPVALVGGATGMVGDPSGKSEERNLLSENILKHNVECVHNQLARFLDFTSTTNPAIMANNYDWFKDMGFLTFIRDVGKHITVNYMMSKDSVKKRMETGISFTEFSYQLLQGYDFYWLFKNKNCHLQMGGADQWGNMTTGAELIRRMCGGEAFSFTTPLITKADGGKFGKTEKGNIWLDAAKTSPYEFYQFWVNVSDEDAERYIKIFTFISKEEIDTLINQHRLEPHMRLLQTRLAKEVTCMVHSESDYNTAVEASQILFGKGTKEMLEKMDENLFLSVFDGVPQFNISKSELEQGILITDLLAVKTQVFPSKGEARKMIQAGGLSINKEKVGEDINLNSAGLLNGKFLLIQKGKKNYFILKAE
ncbi:MAG: tyrosine--tRNA ligase [Bacteroidia bacterium]|nr:tyrosine--tRNA ligase [Bacteroidia bacterium]